MEQPALQILRNNRIMSIATVRPDGWPQNTIVGYANEGWRLYFLIYRTSQKFANIARDNRVSVSVGPEPRELAQIKAVYAGCCAQEVTDLKERTQAWMLLAERHPNLTDLAPRQNDEVVTMVAECRFVSVLDYSHGLGHAESLQISLPSTSDGARVFAAQCKPNTEYDPIARLRASAGRCRELAEQASDAEVSAALRGVAEEMEALVPFVENSRATLSEFGSA